MIKLVTEHKDYLLLVDTETPIEAYKTPCWNDIASCLVQGNKIEDFFCTASLSKEKPFNEGGTVNLFQGINAIIAASPKLGDLPLLPELPKQEEDVEELAWTWANEQFSYNQEKYAEGYIKGYKAASKKWTDEDIECFFLYASSYLSVTEEVPKYDLFKSMWKGYLESLSPTLTPIGFEPELDWKDTLLPYRDLSKRQYKVVNNILQGTYKFK